MEQNTSLTLLFTELKLLQIDLDEKYQELISTAVSFNFFNDNLKFNLTLFKIINFASLLKWVEMR